MGLIDDDDDEGWGGIRRMMVMEMIYDDDEVRCVREMKMRKVRENQRERERWGEGDWDVREGVRVIIEGLRSFMREIRRVFIVYIAGIFFLFFLGLLLFQSSNFSSSRSSKPSPNKSSWKYVFHNSLFLDRLDNCAKILQSNPIFYVFSSSLALLILNLKIYK